MTLAKFKLGDLITESNDRNKDDSLSVELVRGVVSSGYFCATKANMSGVTLSNYKIVRKNYFAYNPSRLNIGSISFSREEKVIVSPMYIVFRIIRTDLLLPEYLLMYIRRNEFLRYTSFCASGSVRDIFDFSTLCDVDITLPPLDVQQKYVDIYNAILKNQQSYERGLNNLKLSCDALIENLGDNCKNDILGKYIKRNRKRNTGAIYSVMDVKGFNNNGEFIRPMRLFSGNIATFKIISNGDFVYNSRINSTITKLSIALNEDENLIVSPAYETFCVANQKELHPFYLYMLWYIYENIIQKNLIFFHIQPFKQVNRLFYIIINSYVIIIKL